MNKFYQCCCLAFANPFVVSLTLGGSILITLLLFSLEGSTVLYVGAAFILSLGIKLLHPAAFVESRIQHLALIAPLSILLALVFLTLLEKFSVTINTLSALGGLLVSCLILSGLLAIYLIRPRTASYRQSLLKIKKNKDSILLEATVKGRNLAIAACRKLRADFSQRDKAKEPLLNVATKNDHGDTAKLLLTLDCDLNTTNKLGLSALHIAASKINLRLLKVLLQAGADPNHRDIHGKTPLHRLCSHQEIHIADQNEYFSAVQLLLEKGADPNQEDKRGKTPHSLATESGHTSLVSFLQQFGNNSR